MDPTITEVGGGVVGGGTVLYLLLRLVKLAEGALETWRSKRSGNGHADDANHGAPREPERRRSDRAELHVLREILEEVRGMRSDAAASTATLLERTHHMAADIQSLKHQ